MPLGIVLGEALVDDAWPGPAFRFARFIYSLIFHRHVAAHRHLGGSYPMRVVVRVGLLGLGWRAENLIGLRHRFRGTLFRGMVLSEKQTAGFRRLVVTRDIGMHGHGAD